MNSITKLMQSQYNSSHYTNEELQHIGFKTIGKNVLISRLARIYNAKKISIKDNVRIDDFAILSGNIELGSFVHIANFASITGGDLGVILGDFCGISSYSKIYASSDDFYNGSLVGPCILNEFRGVIQKQVILKRHCHIGSHSLVLPGSHFEIGASLGAMSLNMGRKLKAWSYYFGNPARKIYSIDSKIVLDKEKAMLRLWGGVEASFNFYLHIYILHFNTQTKISNIKIRIISYWILRLQIHHSTLLYYIYTYHSIIKDKYLLWIFLFDNCTQLSRFIFKELL